MESGTLILYAIAESLLYDFNYKPIESIADPEQHDGRHAAHECHTSVGNMHVGFTAFV